jgi:hypothetical protein
VRQVAPERVPACTLDDRENTLSPLTGAVVGVSRAYRDPPTLSDPSILTTPYSGPTQDARGRLPQEEPSMEGGESL